MKITDRNNLGIGILAGVLFPLMGYAILKGLFELLSMLVDSDYGDWRERTITLLAICFNLMPFNFYKNRRYEDAMRGVTIPTVIMGIIWVWVFREFILPS